MSTALFFAAEIETYLPASPPASASLAEMGWGALPWGALALYANWGDSTDTLRVSDMGYRSLPTDPDGVQVYPPYLQSAFAVDVAVNLDPSISAVGASWGELEIFNADRHFDDIGATRNADGRTVVIRAGRKVHDAARNYYVDPSISSLTRIWQGVATPWFLGDGVLSIPLRDATYWLERPVQTDLYGGTGGLDGTSTLAGRARPMARGGTWNDPIRNVTPVLVDPAHLIYQYSDAPGRVPTVYIGGNAGTTYAGDAADLYSGSVAAGQFRTDNSRGLFQLGSSPSNAVTADVVGAFPSGALETYPLDIVRRLLLEDMALPSALIDSAGFASASASAQWVSGLYLDGSETPDGAAAVDMLLHAAGARLMPTLDGRLTPFLLRVPSGAPVLTLDPHVAVSVIPQRLPDSLDPPPWRIRVGYQHCWTVQTSDLVGAVSADRRQFLAQADRIAAWAATGTAALAWRRPNDPPALSTALLRQQDAQSLAAALGALWGVRRRLFSVEVPLDIGVGRWLGDQVRIVWPVQGLSDGASGTVVGVSIQSSNAATITLKVLV
ncbi:hypothetical protein [Granulibacter bethesdensis]|uniref:hypothetical protein n=1 Tax=Granulibacter bethesdensis TaxID=364410 RepID=UPI0003F1D659|nr:hypothetical protein [Granulibacter bethesdensis]AHJ69329.1 Hypothetical protein GbCGDNIH2_5102 [Granulibacter bethesdensis]